jgi:hypothetical protein
MLAGYFNRVPYWNFEYLPIRRETRLRFYRTGGEEGDAAQQMEDNTHNRTGRTLLKSNPIWLGVVPPRAESGPKAPGRGGPF